MERERGILNTVQLSRGFGWEISLSSGYERARNGAELGVSIFPRIPMRCGAIWSYLELPNHLIVRMSWDFTGCVLTV